MNLTLRCQEHVEFTYSACMRKMAEVYCLGAGAEAMRDPELLQKWKVVLPMCDPCCPLKKSSYASAKEEVTASSIVQFECVS